MIVRPATPDDLPALLALAHSAGTGLTTLAADASRLRQRLEWAAKTFVGEAERADADYLTGLGNKTFIAELMPKFPLPTCLLPETARTAIGRVHPNTEPALGMLKAEGFEHRDYIDIFDGGPLIECATGDIRAVRDSQVLQLSIGTPGEQAATYLIYNRQFADCRITAAAARVAAGTLIVDAQVAGVLGLSAGDSLRAVSLAVPALQQSAA
jgi:arginine N-succinyltransferase